MIKLAVFASTNASDLPAIVDAINQKTISASVEVVIADRPCGAVEKARKYGIPVIVLDPKGKKREEFDRLIHAELKKHDIDLILLIGYMRIISSWFVNEYSLQIVNVHPSLLPAFSGGMNLNVHAEVLKAGVKETGATLHFVDDTVDGGPIIMQEKVIVDNDTAETLKNKVQKAEQKMFVRFLDLYDKGKVIVGENKVIIED